MYKGLLGRGDQIQAQFGSIFRFLHRREVDFKSGDARFDLTWRKENFRKLSFIMIGHLRHNHVGMYEDDHEWADINFNCSAVVLSFAIFPISRIQEKQRTSHSSAKNPSYILGIMLRISARMILLSITVCSANELYFGRVQDNLT